MVWRGRTLVHSTSSIFRVFYVLASHFISFVPGLLLIIACIICALVGDSFVPFINNNGAISLIWVNFDFFLPYFERFSMLKILCLFDEFVVYNFIDHNFDFIIYDVYEPKTDNIAIET